MSCRSHLWILQSPRWKNPPYIPGRYVSLHVQECTPTDRLHLSSYQMPHMRCPLLSPPLLILYCCFLKFSLPCTWTILTSKLKWIKMGINKSVLHKVILSIAHDSQPITCKNIFSCFSNNCKPGKDEQIWFCSNKISFVLSWQNNCLFLWGRISCVKWFMCLTSCAYHILWDENIWNAPFKKCCIQHISVRCCPSTVQWSSQNCFPVARASNWRATKGKRRSQPLGTMITG